MPDNDGTHDSPIGASKQPSVRQWLNAMPAECEAWWKEQGCNGSGFITIGGDSVQGYTIDCPGCARCRAPEASPPDSDQPSGGECPNCERRLYRDRLMVAPAITTEELPTLCLGLDTGACIEATTGRIDKLYREAASWRVGFMHAKEAIGADENTDLVDAIVDLRERAARAEQTLGLAEGVISSVKSALGAGDDPGSTLGAARRVTEQLAVVTKDRDEVERTTIEAIAKWISGLQEPLEPPHALAYNIRRGDWREAAPREPRLEALASNRQNRERAWAWLEARKPNVPLVSVMAHEVESLAAMLDAAESRGRYFRLLRMANGYGIRDGLISSATTRIATVLPDAPEPGDWLVKPLHRNAAQQLVEDANLRLTAESRVGELASALRRVQQWDCLNPPATHLCVDFPWLKKLVDDALDDASYEAERSAAQAMSAPKG